MAISHFTLKACPNPECPSNQDNPPAGSQERVVGDPVAELWHCFVCMRSGGIMFTIFDPNAES